MLRGYGWRPGAIVLADDAGAPVALAMVGRLQRFFAQFWDVCFKGNAARLDSGSFGSVESFLMVLGRDGRRRRGERLEFFDGTICCGVYWLITLI